jgi:hypothetical protein
MGCLRFSQVIDMAQCKCGCNNVEVKTAPPTVIRAIAFIDSLIMYVFGGAVALSMIAGLILVLLDEVVPYAMRDLVDGSPENVAIVLTIGGASAALAFVIRKPLLQLKEWARVVHICWGGLVMFHAAAYGIADFMIEHHRFGWDRFFGIMAIASAVIYLSLGKTRALFRSVSPTVISEDDGPRANDTRMRRSEKATEEGSPESARDDSQREYSQDSFSETPNRELTKEERAALALAGVSTDDSIE